MSENTGPGDDLVRAEEDDAGDRPAVADLDADEVGDDVVGGTTSEKWLK